MSTKVTLDDGLVKALLEYEHAETTTEVAWMCFHLLMAVGHAPENICKAFQGVGEEAYDAWFDSKD